MIKDLFVHKSAKDMLYDYIKQKKWVRTSEVIKFASDNFSNRGDRDARLLASEGKIKRMNEQKKLHLFGPIREDVYEIIDWHNNFKI